VCYRADLFEKLGVSPPADWTLYQQAVERLADVGADNSPISATLEPLADGWAGQLLLAAARVICFNCRVFRLCAKRRNPYDSRGLQEGSLRPGRKWH
jgi:hypothetical protein